MKGYLNAIFNQPTKFDSILANAMDCDMDVNQSIDESDIKSTPVLRQWAKNKKNYFPVQRILIIEKSFKTSYLIEMAKELQFQNNLILFMTIRRPS